jgi:hypothetical protein
LLINKEANLNRVGLLVFPIRTNMKKFESMESVEQSILLPTTQSVAIRAMGDLIRACGGVELYDPLDHGSVVVIEKGDTAEDIADTIGSSLETALFEGAIVDEGHLVTCVLFSNEGGYTIVIPESAPWVSELALERILDSLVPPMGNGGQEGAESGPSDDD